MLLILYRFYISYTAPSVMKEPRCLGAVACIDSTSWGEERLGQNKALRKDTLVFFADRAQCGYRMVTTEGHPRAYPKQTSSISSHPNITINKRSKPSAIPVISGRPLRIAVSKS